ncbi:MAG: PaaI family thioesterase [Sediminimonas qiaohouensis]|uniref:Medium/long-chain acyl-CoA thioesterase YigI n=1 Tax=Sediminimonas qiaohouensis TaxID=552061 RepID=A0A7C9L8D2_9RHOB|nr:PaaI family thioesterase [Sediminimonas qiaohouensis]MTJ04574.1 PaaI family thioesterase [Sediminimonas qiaohouensis]
MTTPELDPDIVEAPYPFQSHLGFSFAAWSTDYCRLELPLTPALMNRYGIPHGGVHAAMLDSAMGFAGCYTDDKDAPRLAMTLSLNVNYLGQARGGTLLAEGHRTGGGRKTFFADGKITDEHGTVIATGTGVFRYRA